MVIFNIGNAKDILIEMINPDYLLKKVFALKIGEQCSFSRIYAIFSLERYQRQGCV
jgi:hypothetical protein